MQLFVRKKTILAFIVTLWVVISSGGVFLNTPEIVPYTLAVNAILVIFNIYRCRRIFLQSNIERLGVLITLSILMFLSMITNDDTSSFLTYLRILLAIALSMTICMTIEISELIDNFANVVLFLAITSLIFFYSGLLETNFWNIETIEFNQHAYINAFLYSHLVTPNPRNASLFIEPGLFQIFLNFALLAILLRAQSANRKFILAAILLAAIYSTNSTSGFISSIIVLVGWALSGSSTRKTRLSTIAKFLFGFAVSVAILTSNFFLTNIEEKFSAEKQKSFQTRQNSTLIDMYIVSENVLAGSGAGNYQAELDKHSSRGLTIDAATNTFTQLAALFGIPLVAVIIIRLLRLLRSLPFNYFTKISFAAIFLISFSTEPFVLYPIFYLPLFIFSTRTSQRI